MASLEIIGWASSPFSTGRTLKTAGMVTITALLKRDPFYYLPQRFTQTLRVLVDFQLPSWECFISESVFIFDKAFADCPLSPFGATCLSSPFISPRLAAEGEVGMRGPVPGDLSVSPELSSCTSFLDPPSAGSPFSKPPVPVTRPPSPPLTHRQEDCIKTKEERRVPLLGRALCASPSSSSSASVALPMVPREPILISIKGLP